MCLSSPGSILRPRGAVCAAASHSCCAVIWNQCDLQWELRDLTHLRRVDVYQVHVAAFEVTPGVGWRIIVNRSWTAPSHDVTEVRGVGAAGQLESAPPWVCCLSVVTVTLRCCNPEGFAALGAISPGKRRVFQKVAHSLFLECVVPNPL